MPTALLPNGQKTYVDSNLDISVSFPDSNTRVSVERTLRQGLSTDPRQLFVRVQGGGGYGAWCFWIQWGRGANCCRTPAIVLSENERTPAAILSRIKAELSNLEPRPAAIH